MQVLLEIAKLLWSANALNVMLGPQDVIPTDALEALAKSILASSSCLKHGLPAIAAQLHPVLAILPDSERAVHVRLQPKGKPPLPTADAMRQAADLVAAAAGRMPAIGSQVNCSAHLWDDVLTCTCSAGQVAVM